MNLDSFLKERGYPSAPYNEMKPHFESWQQWWENEVKDFHNYSIKQNSKDIKMKRERLGMAKTVSETYADLLLNEKVKYNVGDNEDLSLEFNENILEPNDWEMLANNASELTMALGTGAFVQSIKNIEITEDGDIVSTDNAQIDIEFVTVDKIRFKSFNKKNVFEVAFVSEQSQGDKIITIVSEHLLINGTYEIHNHFFETSDKGELTEIPSDDTASIFKTGDSKPWFSIMRTNIVNNINKSSPYGISVFANAISVLKGIDIAYDSFVWEFKSGKKRIFADAEALGVDNEGNPTFDTNDVVFYSLKGLSYGDNDTNEPKKLVHESNMELRVTDHVEGLNKLLSLLSFKCGLGEGYFKFENGMVKTATEVVSQDSALFRSIRKHQIAIENCLYDFFETLIATSNEYLHTSLTDDISIDFDDSIIVDESEIQRLSMVEFNAGLKSPIQYYIDTMNLTEDQAIEYHNKQVEWMSNGEDFDEEGGEI